MNNPFTTNEAKLKRQATEAGNAFREALAEQPAQQQGPVANASTWFALVMNAAAELEDASHCLRDEDAKRVAISGAKHYRDAANALYTSPPASKPCKGIPRKGCNYLTACDTVCNKCGEIHHHHQMVANFDAPASKPLTDEEIAKIAEKYTEPLLFRVKDFARAIEAAHGIKE